MRASRAILAMLAVIAASACVTESRGESSEQRAAEEARAELVKQGYKVDVSEFDFSSSGDLRARAAALTNARPNWPQGHWPTGRLPELCTVVDSNKAVVLWKQNTWYAEGEKDFWTVLPGYLEENQRSLDVACQALLSGPIRFDLKSTNGNYLPLAHLPAMRTFAQTLGLRGVVELHNHNPDAAWTNFLAATRVVTAWETEPLQISQILRFQCANAAFDATWQALQWEGWSDEQLARLQQEWESVDFFKALPETVAFTRAGTVLDFQRFRNLPGPKLNVNIPELRQSPKSAWNDMNYVLEQSRYRSHGSYEDEKGCLLYFRDRESEIRRAIQCRSWPEMRAICGATNRLVYVSTNRSPVQMRMNTMQMSMAMQTGGLGLPALAAEAEARRRVLLTAIALNRYRSRHHSLPDSLTRLVPEFLKDAPVDFMDGQPLRYHPMDGGHFVVYSIGLDGVDNGGMMPSEDGQSLPYLRLRRGHSADLVWPNPATVEEAEASAREKQARAEEAVRARQRQYEEEEQAQEAARKIRVSQLLAEAAAQTDGHRPATPEPLYDGKPLSTVLAGKPARQSRLTLDEMLTLKQVITGEEPEIVTFELPVSYDVVTNIGLIRLLVDPGQEAAGYEATAWDFERATNGNGRLVWNTTYDRPGQHALQARFASYRPMNSHIEAKGPILPFFSSNLCWFSESAGGFTRDGAMLYARLEESNANYVIELKTPAGQHVNTIAGTTTNAEIAVTWNLKDDRGNAYTNDVVNAFFRISPPGSAKTNEVKLILNRWGRFE